MSSAGTPAITSISRTSREPTRRRQRADERSASTSAMPITTASFANSDGWIERPRTRSQDREPLIVDPMVRTSTSPETDSR